MQKDTIAVAKGMRFAGYFDSASLCTVRLDSCFQLWPMKKYL
jgi:hypothetical protein